MRKNRKESDLKILNQWVRFGRASEKFILSAKELPEIDRWAYARQLARKQLSIEAQMKLEWIIFYHTDGKQSATYTAHHFDISRKTLHKWLKRYNDKDLAGLEERPRKPLQTRRWEVTQEEQLLIKEARKENMAVGKMKLKIIIQELYGVTISTWKIGRVIKRYNLFPPPGKKNRPIRRKNSGKIRIHTMREEIKENETRFGYLWHVDAIKVPWAGCYRYIITGIEHYTRIGFAHIYASLSSQKAKDFLLRLLYLSNDQLEIMHTDNGSEFQGKFEELLQAEKRLHIHSRSHHPTDNPRLERFNRTVQEEWLWLSPVGLDNLEEANRDLTEWIIKYNFVRPHQAIGYKTPIAFALETSPQLLPKSPSHTPRLLGSHFWL